MNTRTGLRYLVWGGLVLSAIQARGQASILGHAGGPLDHLGWNAGTLQALEVRHDGNWPIDFFTNNSQRMRLNPTQNNTINTFTVPTDGFLGLGPNGTAGNTAPLSPWTRLHLHDNVTTGAAVQNGFRNWMRNGIFSVEPNSFQPKFFSVSHALVLVCCTA